MDKSRLPFRAGRLRMRHLMLVQRLADLGSMRKAAESLDITQPAASAILKELESQLGLTLFARGRTGMTPSGEGRALLRRIRIVLNEVDALAEDLRDPLGHRPVVRLGTVPHAHLGILRDLASLCVKSGRFRLRVQEGPSPMLLERLLSGELDAFVGRLPTDAGPAALSADVGHQRLYEEPMGIACGVNHRLAKARRVTVDELRACHWVLPSPESLSRRALEEAFLLHGHAAPTPLIEVSSFVYGLEMVAHADVLTVAPGTAIRTHERQGLVRTLKTPLQMRPTTIYWMRRRSSDADVVLDELEQWLLRSRRKVRAAPVRPPD
jgi:DNA-binding transcriptional LysR family regulator